MLSLGLNLKLTGIATVVRAVLTGAQRVTSDGTQRVTSDGTQRVVNK